MITMGFTYVPAASAQLAFSAQLAKFGRAPARHDAETPCGDAGGYPRVFTNHSIRQQSR